MTSLVDGMGGVSTNSGPGTGSLDGAYCPGSID